MNDKADCKTAPATPGLLISLFPNSGISYFVVLYSKGFILYRNKKDWVEERYVKNVRNYRIMKSQPQSMFRKQNE